MRYIYQTEQNHNAMQRIYFFKQLFTLLFFLYGLLLNAQQKGENSDPYAQGKGEPPYEMKNRTEERQPVITFEDCTQWQVEATGCEANLYRSNDQLLYRDYVGKLRYSATEKRSEITLRMDQPMVLEEDWDCINFWNYGAHWNWVAEEEREAFRCYVVIEDANGYEHEVNFVQSGNNRMVHKYWFMNHIKLKDDIVRPVKLTGLRFKGNAIALNQPTSIYLGPIYTYQEALEPLSFEPYPGKLPFPLRKQTILPINKVSNFENNITKAEGHYDLTYKGQDAWLNFRIYLSDKFPLDISHWTKKTETKLFHNGIFEFDMEGDLTWEVKSQMMRNDTLWITAHAVARDASVPFRFYYTIQQKSLVIGMQELSQTGHVERIHLGEIGPTKDARLFRIPFLNFDYKKAPHLLYSNDLFYFMQFDWYVTNASNFYATYPGIEDGYASHNGGVNYIPKTNGERNPLKERLFVNISPDVHEVFPTIDNPPSPMRSAQAHRLWRINGNPNHNDLKQEAKHLRSLGIENLSIRYHEGIWRDGGESYTFRLETAPGRGGNPAVKQLVDYVKSKGWRVGLYSNYTDFAPVNAHWDEDWVQQGPQGEWQVSWARCFAPKPMRALEAQRQFAPQIHAQFGTNHSYCDVHTAISPMSRVDYDYRVPGAGTFRRTFECYGQILMNEKVAYAGPVYSEGGNHWWYAGLVDGNYANAYPSLLEQDIFPDFHLLKIHPLEMDAGNVYAKGNKYLAYTLAYGNIGICDGDEQEMMKRYYMLQPLQSQYSMVPVTTILYEHEGRYYEASEALVKGYTKNARLKTEYMSGFVTYVNFGEEPWLIEVNGEELSLPQYGHYASSKDGLLMSRYAGQEGESAFDYMQSPSMFYLDTKGKYVETDHLAGKGQIAIKRETFGWEIIPATDFEELAFDPSIMNLPEEVTIHGVDANDVPIEYPVCKHRNGKIVLKHDNKKVLKYRISPTQ
jgi:hypothetical protein